MIDWNLFQYNACIAITGAIWGTSKEKLDQELGLESLGLRRWYGKLCLFYKTSILNTFSISFLSEALHTQQGLCTTFPFLKQNILFLKNSFFPSPISEWNKLDPSLRKSENFVYI